ATPPATEHELWSSYKGIPYPIVEVDSANGTFYVQSVFEWHFGGAVEYTWLPANLTGTDFSIGYAAYEIASANLALTKVPSGLPSTAVACGT
ncbi:MAG: hypothetical protein QOE90_3333, partial [Thermoplasmata archaeon]|nr:hypothetical protein [Thermoplasmata archaeon]